MEYLCIYHNNKVEKKNVVRQRRLFDEMNEVANRTNGAQYENVMSKKQSLQQNSVTILKL